MLAQFQARYPTGSLISELLTIYHGKFIVRVSVQVEGVQRATGMAAEESLELAEDRARSRALVVLGIQPVASVHSSKAPQSATNQVQMDLIETALPPPIKQTHQSNSFATTSQFKNPTPNQISLAPDERTGNQSSELANTVAGVPGGSAPRNLFGSLQSELSQTEESAPAPESLDFAQKSDRFSIATTYSEREPDATVGNLGIESGTETGFGSNPTIPFDNVTPLVPRSYSSQESAESFIHPEAETEESLSSGSLQSELDNTAEIKTSEPVEDLSDVLADIQIQLEISSWKPKQESDYLERTYGKQSSAQLDKEELLDFLSYLELFNKTTEKITKLKWNSKQGQDYLFDRYEKRSRHLLTKQEMLKFLDDLESLLKRG